MLRVFLVFCCVFPASALLAAEPEMAVSEAAGTGWLSTALAYVPVGFAHILPLGLDHILFVLALFFMTPNVGPLILQITIFTLAHSVTLALGAFGIVSIPGSIVEPVIAASIVFVAAENMFARRVTGWRIGVIFLFGLLHGLGFASVLVTHDFAEALKLADRIAVMDRGRIIQSGTPQELISNPANETVESLLAAPRQAAADIGRAFREGG